MSAGPPGESWIDYLANLPFDNPYGSAPLVGWQPGDYLIDHADGTSSHLHLEPAPGDDR